MTTTHPRIASVVEEQAVRLLATYAKYDEWDLPPSVGVVVDEGESPQPVPLELPVDIWKVSNPDVILTMLAGCFRSGAMRLGTNSKNVSAPNIIGALIVMESWMVNTAGWTDQERVELDEWAENNSLKDHPSADVRECRDISAIDSSGIIAFGQQIRGGPADQRLFSARPGSVSTALSALMTAIRETSGSVMNIDVE